MKPSRLRGLLAERGGGELFERLTALDGVPAARVRSAEAHGWRLPRAAAIAFDLPAVESTDFDVIVAGGGVAGLLLAAQLGRAGLRSALFEQRQVAVAQREWNISRPELQALVRSGLFNDQQVDALVVARYAHGICRWHGGGSYPVQGALDCAIDAAGLLDALRERCLAAGVELHERQAVVGERYGDSAVAIEVADAPRSRSARRSTARGSTREVTARVLVDARGAGSPHCAGDLICPTVGGVFSGFELGDAPDQVDPTVGEVLATIDDVDGGRQHVWELFPGRPGEATVYLFYYALRDDPQPVSLVELYGRFFSQLDHYKRGPGKLLRPTFGIIPGWSRLQREAPAPHPRCVLVGDAAARQSPLTCCGFGHAVRHAAALADQVSAIAAQSAAVRASALRDEPIHAGTGALALMLARPPRAVSRRHEVNALLDAAFAELHAMGNPAFAALLRDELPFDQFVTFLRRAASRRPQIWHEVLRRLGPLPLARWGANLLRERIRVAL